jgi:hypothetical protein
MVGFSQGVFGMTTGSTSPSPHPYDAISPLRVRELLFHHFSLTTGVLHRVAPFAFRSESYGKGKDSLGERVRAIPQEGGTISKSDD